MKKLLTYCTLLLLTANSLFAYQFPPHFKTQVKQVILDSLGLEEEMVKEEKVAFKPTVNRLAFAMKMGQIDPLLNDDVLFTDSNINVMKVHPNPATVVAYLDYKMTEKIQAKLTIRNLLGKVVDEFSMPQGEHRLKIPTANYDSGVYFYTLTINGKVVKSKKLIVGAR
jgi:hypothetical protein